MFSFMKKKDSKKECTALYAVMEGKCIDITDVNDGVFSEKIMGDGFAVIPSGNQIYAPCDGKISMVAETKHAVGIKTDDGKEILIHAGLDTVNLKGKGFTVSVKADDKVKQGDKLLEFDTEVMKSEDINMTTMVIVTEMGEAASMTKQNLGSDVDCSVLVLEFA